MNAEIHSAFRLQHSELLIAPAATADRLEADAAPNRRRDDAQLRHQAIELRRIERLRAVAERAIRIAVHLDDESIGTGGNMNVMLCERGIRTFESFTRNTMDISAIPVAQQLSHLPVLADPSHGTGRRDKVIPMARAGVAAGADGLLIEVHDDPEKALSDGAQSLYPEQFDRLMGELRVIAPVLGRSLPLAPVPAAGGR